MHYLDIELKGIDENGNEKNYKLSDFKGENIILYFYPQDDTPTCTLEAQKFNEALEKLKKFARIIGVSSNDIDEHTDFQKKHNLKFILLSDKLNELKKAFDEHKNHISDIERTTFIIDKNGKVTKVWEKVDVDGHTDEILEYFKNN